MQRRPQFQRQYSRLQPYGMSPARHAARYLWYVAGFLVVLGLMHALTSHASTAISEIQSGIAGYCLDDHNSKMSVNAVVDSWRCNGTSAQAWVADSTSIHRVGAPYCLSVQGDAMSAGSKIVMNKCTAAPGQVWLRDQGGYLNPNSGLCLALPNNRTSRQLIAASCSNLADAALTWHIATSQADSKGLACGGSEGERVACYAVKEWVRWQSPGSDHTSLLSQYTDGAPYEAWCADFVSFVYKESGYPFTGGETDGWDENNANNIQRMGFTVHDPATYIPQPGDVAYFNYDGGHVEIVVSGGRTPTFIYGNSGTLDPETGNGQMKANTITDDGSSGHLVYYLSPNHG